jgi:hypothetical protein
VNVYELAPRFRALFDGLDTAFGTGRGQWIKRPPRTEDFVDHLMGKGPGIGIAPLRPDNTVTFAAIDLDAPDFEGARAFQQWIPGPSFIERSRSGNAHVWVFFDGAIQAWVAMGILRYAIDAAGYKHVEVFPKAHDFSRVALGNYINLPFHGHERPILSPADREIDVETFLDLAKYNKNSPEDWRKRAAWLMIEDPATRESRADREFGTSRNLHICAQYVLDGALDGDRPIAQGHRSVVYFNLAKQFANCELWSEAETLEALRTIRDASDEALGQPRKSDSELARYVRNAYDKRYTSTGCDDPVFEPYASPACPIAHPRRTR